MASFLAFLGSPELAGGVLGFFVGIGKGLFEDLTIFLQIPEMWAAIQQMPALIGQLLDDPSLLLDMVRDMVDGILAKANLINPYGPSSMSVAEFADWLVEVFWWYVDPFNNPFPSLGQEDRFNLAFAVTHLTGYLIQQFIIGTGLAKVFGKLNEAGKLAKITNKLEDASSVLKKVAEKTRKVTRLVAQKLGLGTARTAERFLVRAGLGHSDEFLEGAGRFITKFGNDPSTLRKIADNLGYSKAADDALKVAKADPEGWGKMLKRMAKKPDAGDAFQLKRAAHWLDETPSGKYVAAVDQKFQADIILRNLDDGSLWKVVDQKDWYLGSRNWDEFIDEINRD